MFIAPTITPTAPTRPYPKLYLPMVARFETPFTGGVEIWPGMGVLFRDELTELRPRFVRTYALWSELEPTEGTYTWDARIDADIEAILGAGAAPYVTIKMTPPWARQHPDNPCSPMAMGALNAYGGFIYRLVRRYPEVRYWSIGNEPDLPGVYPYYGCVGEDPQLYADMLQTAYSMIHIARADAVVVAGEVAFAGEFLENMLRELPPFDALAYHFYAREADDLVLLNMAQATVEELLKRYEYAVPVFLSETGFLTQNETPATLDMQANWVDTVNEFATDNGLGGWIWYSLPDPGWCNAGLLTADGAPKPAYWRMMAVGGGR